MNPADWDNSEDIYIKSEYRRNTFFNNFPDSDFYASNSTMLRVHELLVFEGNHVDSEHFNTPDFPTATSVVLSSGQVVTISDQKENGPYLRFDINSSITKILERYSLDNLIFENVDNRQLQRTSVQNCLHSIETGVCFSCLPGYMLTVNGSGCRLCEAPTRYFPPLDICVSIVSSSTSLSELNINKFTITSNNVDPFDLGLPVNQVNDVFGYLTSSPPYSVTSLNEQSVFSLGDDFIHVLEAEVNFDFTEEEFMGNAFFGLSFFSSVNGTEIVNFLFDRSYNILSNVKRQKFYATIYANSSKTIFEKMSFFFSNDSKGGSSQNLSLSGYISTTDIQ